jgi:hypothetical protein
MRQNTQILKIIYLFANEITTQIKRIEQHLGAPEG